MDEKRKFTRIEFPMPAKYHFKGEEFSITIRDISVRGLFAEALATPIQGDEITITILLSEAQNNSTITCEAKVIRTSIEGFAVEFTKVDLESFTLLKNIIAYNIGDAQRVVKEIVDNL